MSIDYSGYSGFRTLNSSQIYPIPPHGVVGGTMKLNNSKRKFKDGNLVETTRRLDNFIPFGTIGTVRNYHDGFYDIEFEPGNTEDDTRLHNCNGSVPSKLGWHCTVDQLQLTSKRAKVDFATVVMPEEKRQQILEALEQINQQNLIFDLWGFGKTIEKGRGISMLFYGLPGTGKTLTAQAIADKLGRTLKIVAVAEIESSEPGQAERNIRLIFKQAKASETILLFDECDSLLYDRASIGSILGAQVNELLSSIEKFEGITIFTTNRLATLDEAIERRLALKLEFAMPDQEQRAEIWKRMFPSECPLDEDIDFLKLASVELAGGHIKNAVLRAARIAATEKVSDKKKKITMTHLVRALHQEGKSMIDFHKAKSGFNTPRLLGGNAQIGRTNQLQVTRTINAIQTTDQGEA